MTIQRNTCESESTLYIKDSNTEKGSPEVCLGNQKGLAVLSPTCAEPLFLPSLSTVADFPSQHIPFNSCKLFFPWPCHYFPLSLPFPCCQMPLNPISYGQVSSPSHGALRTWKSGSLARYQLENHLNNHHVFSPYIVMYWSHAMCQALS